MKFFEDVDNYSEWGAITHVSCYSDEGATYRRVFGWKEKYERMQHVALGQR